MEAQTHTAPAPWRTPTEDELVALAVAVGLLPDRPVDHVHYDYATGALVRVPAGARRPALEVV